jgi:2-dehydropantoate 2-reductase
MHVTKGRVAVLGPGGVGGLLAALLARDGYDVVCVARDHTAQALTERGLSLRSNMFGTFTAPVLGASRLTHPVDMCIVTVKAPELEPALDRLPPGIVGGCRVVPFLNGLDHVALLRRHYPDAVVTPATIQVEAVRVGPGVIQHTSPFARVGLCDAAPVAETFTQVGLTVVEHDDEVGLLWDKLARLAPLALVTAYARLPIGPARRQHARLLDDVVQEVSSVALADGAAVDRREVHAFLAGLPDAMTSSLHRDVDAGRAGELDAIGGAVVRAARRHAVRVPATERVVAQIAAAVEHPRKQPTAPQLPHAPLG